MDAQDRLGCASTNKGRKLSHLPYKVVRCASAAELARDAGGKKQSAEVRAAVRAAERECMAIVPAELVALGVGNSAKEAHARQPVILTVTLERQPHQKWGYRRAFQGAAVVITFLTEGSPAHSCGQLRVSDEILAINGTPVSPSSYDALLPPQEATKMTLEISGRLQDRIVKEVETTQ